MISFRGAYTAIVTPFTSDGTAVDHHRLAEQLRVQAEGGITGVVPAGTTGECPTLSEIEHCELIERTLEIGRPLGLQVVAGAGSNNTAHAVHLQRFCGSAGVDATLQVNPYYNKPSQEGLYRHFMTIADAADVPVVLYNVPPRTAVGLTATTVARLSEHPNIRAIKEASGSLDLASEIRARCGITILSGDDSLTLPIMAIGGAGVISVLSNIMPAAVSALCDAANGDDFARARELHGQLFELCRGLLTLDTNPVPIKAAMEVLGRDSGALRLPMCRGSRPLFEAVERLLGAAGLSAATPAAAR